jgi:hypothetical protein
LDNDDGGENSTDRRNPAPPILAESSEPFISKCSLATTARRILVASLVLDHPSLPGSAESNVSASPRVWHLNKDA